MAIFTEKLNQLKQNTGQVKLGAGVVGHTSYVVVAAIVTIGLLALVLANNVAVCIDAILVLGGLTAYYLRGTWQFADKHPDAAALAGTAWPKPAASSEKPTTAPAPVTIKPQPVVPLRDMTPAPAEPAAMTVPPSRTNGDASTAVN